MLRIPRTALHGSPFAVAHRLPRVVPGAACGVALAVLLGACGTVRPGAESAPPETAPAGLSRIDSLMPAALKNAETAMQAYTRSRRNERAAREAALAAQNAALVARHRYSTGTADYVAVLIAEQHLASTEDQLKSASAEAQAARRQLYNSLGFSAFGAAKVPVSAPAQFEPPADVVPSL